MVGRMVGQECWKGWQDRMVGRVVRYDSSQVERRSLRFKEFFNLNFLNRDIFFQIIYENYYLLGLMKA